jgi:hypothetical protein
MTQLACPSNLRQGRIARVSCAAAAGTDIVFPGIATTTTLSQLSSATIYAIAHQEMCLLWSDVGDTL